ncbi:MAG: glycosyltransferase family 4 protein [Candidatus Krumholzibacteria bacterium]|nr:glycosyltransferase family 4 protein [Candidatus Krumholzibacteria bacterium]
MEDPLVQSSRLRRVAFLIDDLGYGGAQKQLRLLVGALRAHADVEVHVLSTITEPYADLIRASGVPVFSYARRFRSDITFFPSLLRALWRSGAGVVHGFLDAADIYAFHAARTIRAAAVLSIQSDRITAPGPRAGLLRYALRRADAVTANSVAGRDFLARTVGVESDRLHLVTNWIDIPASAPGASPEPVVGFAGRLVTSKRADLLLEAMVHVRRRVPGARLVFLGEGPERAALERRASRAGPPGAVSFEGAVANVESWLPRFGCVAIPSAFEGLPNVAVEALAAGVPIVALPVGDLPDLVREGRTGALVREVTPEALGEAIVRVLGDEALREAARREGPLLASERFSLPRAAAAFAAIYRDACAQKKTGRR